MTLTKRMTGGRWKKSTESVQVCEEFLRHVLWRMGLSAIDSVRTRWTWWSEQMTGVLGGAGENRRGTNYLSGLTPKLSNWWLLCRQSHVICAFVHRADISTISRAAISKFRGPFIRSRRIDLSAWRGLAETVGWTAKSNARSRWSNMFVPDG